MQKAGQEQETSPNNISTDFKVTRGWAVLAMLSAFLHYQTSFAFDKVLLNTLQNKGQVKAFPRFSAAHPVLLLLNSLQIDQQTVQNKYNRNST